MQYINADKIRSEVEQIQETGCESPISVCNDILSYIDFLQQEQSKKRLIQVKCLYPYDESWQKNKVYTCEVWHHGDLNRDFWDVYYDYGKDPKYVQFPTIELLNEEFVIIQEESQVKQEQPEMDLEEAVFKEWGTTKEEYLAKSMDKVHLEMEITTYLQDWDDDDEIGLHLSTDNGSIPIELEDIRDLARHFAEWQKEQMLKDAVEGFVATHLTSEGTKVTVNSGYLPKEMCIKPGDKVRIIIVKEEK